MKYFALVLVMVVAVSLWGCFVPSLHPLYTDKDTYLNPALMGTWSTKDINDGIWKFEKGTGPSYKLTITTFKTEGNSTTVSPGDFIATLVKLDKNDFLDLFPVSDSKNDEMYGIKNAYVALHVVPVHTFFKFKIEGDKLYLVPLSLDWTKKKFSEKKLRIQHEVLSGDDFVLTAPPRDLQRFIKTYAEDTEAFPPGDFLTREK